MAQHFKDLVVWQKAMDLVVAVYKISEGFPQRDAFSAASSHPSRSQLHNSWYWVLATGY